MKYFRPYFLLIGTLFFKPAGNKVLAIRKFFAALMTIKVFVGNL